jgi:F1F0 ATPase subunit 2
MNESLSWLLVCGAGALLGLFYFGGLLWTVRRVASMREPSFLFVGSLLIRMSVVLITFYYVGDGVWQRYGACLFGFVLMRFVVVHWKPISFEKSNRQPKEAPRATQP